jgi:surface polysaccharide O-acyltransferase-like enzyme
MNKIVEDKRTTEYFLVIWVVATFCLPYLPQDIPVISRIIGYLDLKMVTGYAGYMILGYYMVKYSNIEKFISTKLAAVLGILVLAATIICTWLVSAHRNTTVNLTGPLMPSALLLALAVTEIFMNSRITKKNYKLLNKISDNSFGIYLMHRMVEIRLSYKGIHSVMCTPFIAVPVVTVIVLVICYFATSIIRKIPFVGKWMV